MRGATPDSTPDSPPGANREADPPLSLKRLTAAFAQMLGAAPAPAEPPLGAGSGDEPAGPDSDATATAAIDPCEISPRSIVEAVLFVGAAEGMPPSAEDLAAAMRGVEPGEVVAAIAELNAEYQRADAPYEIVRHEGGYRLALRADMERLRDKFRGRAKEAKLSPAALEVLSIIAYQQPVTGKRIDQLRGARSGSLLASLVRRGLVRLDSREQADRCYHTTARFLRVFNLQGVEQLPRAAELDG